MEFLINGEKVEITLENEKTVGDVLKSFEAVCAENHIETIGIELDGRTISAKEFDSILAIPLEDKTRINLSVISEQEIGAAFKSVAQRFESLSERLEQTSVHLQGGNDKAVSIMIADLADAVDFFCHAVSMSALFPDKYSKIEAEGKALKDFFAEFSPVLDDFRRAMEGKDTVTVGDLAEYEIRPRLKSLAAALESL